MKLLPKNKYHLVRSLFHDNYPNLPLVYSVIEQVRPGEIWVDNENNPKHCLILNNTVYCFLAGEIDKKYFLDYLDLIKQKPFVKLAIETSYPLDLTSFGFSPVLRRQYRYKNMHTVPFFENNSGYLLKKINGPEIFNLCTWKNFMEDFYGGASNYFKYGMGFVLWDPLHEVLVSECHGIRSQGFVELGTITHEQYRNKNLSTILCNHFIDYAIRENLQPIWTCDEANISSWKVAEKLGMDDLTKYVFYTQDFSKTRAA